MGSEEEEVAHSGTLGNGTTYIWGDKQDNKEKENLKPGPPRSLVLATSYTLSL